LASTPTDTHRRCAVKYDIHTEYRQLRRKRWLVSAKTFSSESCIRQKRSNRSTRSLSQAHSKIAFQAGLLCSLYVTRYCSRVKLEAVLQHPTVQLI
jgi:hypothetical protein